MRITVATLLTLAFVTSPALGQAPEYRSLAGVEFRGIADTGAIARARAELASDPRNADKYLQLGLAQAAVRQYHNAIATFTKGMAVAPKNALLYRWRGHRYISIGRFDKALADLSRGNALDPSNYDIWYHLGVAHFERGEFTKAAWAFAEAQKRTPNDNEVAGASDWLWMSLARAKGVAAAAIALAPVNDSLKITSATAYNQRLRLYRGIIGPDEVLSPGDTAAVQVATMSFGVGNWYLARGDTANAKRWFQRAVDSGGWPGFAFLAAERELQRLSRKK